MKNILTILLASFILLSGMHFSVARHICGGEVADVKISFSEANASCGMEVNEKTCPVHGFITSDCCQNDISVFTVDNYFSSSSFQVKEVSQPVLQLFFLPLIQSLYSLVPTFQAYKDVRPPNTIIASAVSLPKICVFRIWCLCNLTLFSGQIIQSPCWRKFIVLYPDTCVLIPDFIFITLNINIKYLESWKL